MFAALNMPLGTVPVIGVEGPVANWSGVATFAGAKGVFTVEEYAEGELKEKLLVVGVDAVSSMRVIVKPAGNFVCVPIPDLLFFCE